MGSTQPHEDNWIPSLLDITSSKIRLRKLKLRLRERHVANHEAPCTAICQQPLQSILALQSCSATDLILISIGSRTRFTKPRDNNWVAA